MSLFSLFILYLCFRLKQLSCDYLLQTKWMALGKTVPGWGGYPPLLVHAAIHGVGTLIIFLFFAPHMWWMAFVDILVHAIVDRAKGLLVVHMKWSPHTWKYWWAFGIDQEAHNLTHIVYVGLILAAKGLVV